MMCLNAEWLDMPLSGLADMPILVSHDNQILKKISELTEYTKIRKLGQITRVYLTQQTPLFEQNRQAALLKLVTPFTPRSPFSQGHISEVGDGSQGGREKVDGEDEEGRGDGDQYNEEDEGGEEDVDGEEEDSSEAVIDA